MHLHYRNVNDAFQGIVEGFLTGTFKDHPEFGQRGNHSVIKKELEPTHYFCADCPPISRSPSRYGDVIVINEPVTITYHHPLERILFNAYRDCNPFFHLVEALWTLAGRNDIEPLCHFVKNAANFSDDGVTWSGAYGKRWREAQSLRADDSTDDGYKYFDQLATAIEILKKDRTCRRVVLQMWRPDDLYEVLHNPTCKDVPCNTQVMFLPRREHAVKVAEQYKKSIIGPIVVADAGEIEILDMTVINRSNDMLWGALGSNYVTFSFLLEYVATAAGYVPGVYNQITNNLHVYESHAQVHDNQHGHDTGSHDICLWSNKWEPHKFKEESIAYPPIFPAVGAAPAFMEDIERFFERKDWRNPNCVNCLWETDFFKLVVSPLMTYYAGWKLKNSRVMREAISLVRDRDWKIAAASWTNRRQKSDV